MLLWISCNYATCFVETKNGIIIDTAPIWKKFIGQSIENLYKHLKNKNMQQVEIKW